MNKRKILFTIQSLNLGGIEMALLNLLNRLDPNIYDITIISQCGDGVLLDKLPSHVHVIHYRKSEQSFVLFRKLYNRTKILYWTLRYKHTYDIAVAYCGYCIPSAILARALGKQSYTWVHTDYMTTFRQDEHAFSQFFAQFKMSEFDRIVFVSRRAYLPFVQMYPALKDRCMVIKNQMQVNAINEKVKEFEVTLSKQKEIVFFNVARHDEDSKRLTRVFKACALLKQEGYAFQFASIGDGVDHAMYVDMVRQLDIEDVVTFYGEQRNPYPYFKAGDVFVLSSEYEGDPVVIYEAMILGKNIITTNVGDVQDILLPTMGKIVDKNEQAIYQAMKEYILQGIISYEFDYETFNQVSIDKINQLFLA